MAEQSQFREISIGTVAENKLRTSNEVEIWLDEVHPLVDGEVVGGCTPDSVTCTNYLGDQLTFSVKTSNTILAKWRGDGTNRYTSPDVRRGEKVRIYQYGDTDKYFWETVNMPGQSTRKRETVITVFSNTTDESDNEPNPENSWYQEVNTHDKLITTQTNKNDGEPFAYTQQINAKEGIVVVVADDIGNYIQVNSKEQIIELETASGARFELNKEDINLTCRNFTANVSETMTWNANKGVVTIHNTDWTGNITMKGDYKLNGTMTASGGSYTFNGNVVTTAGITNMGKNIGAGHTHGGVQGGPGSTAGVN